MSAWTPPKHGGDCGGTLCDFCGCCCHSPYGSPKCKMWGAPEGVPCKDSSCGCEGMS